MSDTVLRRGERVALISGGDLNSASIKALDDLVGFLLRTLEAVVLRRHISKPRLDKPLERMLG